MAQLTENEILQKVVQFRADGVAGSANFFDRMRKAEDFVIGEQWDPAVKEAARNKGKFTLTIPIIKPQINQISGEEIQNPQDFIIENTQEGAAVIAKILTALTKQAGDSQLARYEKSQAFRSGIVSGQGVMGVFVDKTNDPKHADLRIEKLNEHNVLVDPNATTYNINKKEGGAKYIVYEEWVDQDLIHVMYPDKKEELEAKGSNSFLEVVAGNIVGIIDWMSGRKNQKETGSFSSRERTDIEVMTKSRYLLSHTFWREAKTCIHWFDKRESELDAMFLHKDADIKLAKKSTKENPDIFTISEVVDYVIHHTIRIKDTFLEDRVDELNGVCMFPIVPFWPYWINGYKSGISEDLIGTQEEINWTHSMALNLVKSISNSGFKIKEDPTGDYSDELKWHGNEDGFVINESKGGGKVERLNPPPFPTYEVFTQRAMENVKAITGRLDIPDRDPKALSGKAKFLDMQKTQQGSMSIMTNWNHTLSILGDLLVDIIRKNDIFSEDEIRAIVDKKDLLDEDLFEQAKAIVLQQIQQQGGKIIQPPQPPNPIRARSAAPEIQARMVEVYQQGMATYSQFVSQVELAATPIAEELLIKLIHSMKIGKYNTKVTVSPMAETMRTIKAIETFELHKTLIESSDVGLDGEDLIEATDVPNKEQLKQGRQKKMESMQQVQQAQEQRKVG
jgi:hypothetical protein